MHRVEVEIPLPPTAVISEDGKYRYFLSRTLNSSGSTVTFIGLNPSTADATADDPTIRRCMGFVRSWGGRQLWMVNLFAFRSTSPAALYSAADPVGAENDMWLERAVTSSDLVLAAWGNHGKLLARADQIRNRFRGMLHALSVTKAGMPGHPLYVRGNTRPRLLGP